MEQRICRRCLAKDMPDASYFDNMYEYIRQLDPEIKAEDPLYEERLSFCKECDHLLNVYDTIPEVQTSLPQDRNKV